MTTNVSTLNRNKIERAARLKWVPISLMRVSPMAQRDLKPYRVSAIAASLGLEQLGTLTVSHRDSYYYIIDGQHRVEALKEIGWGDQQIQCWTYEGLTEEQEADKFLVLNDVLAVDAFSKFRIGVQAGRPEDCEINRIVRAQGLRVSQDTSDGSVSCVGTLRRVFQRSDSATLGKSLRIIRDAYGDSGLVAPVVDGLSLVVARYGELVTEEVAVPRLSAAMGGVGGLLGKANVTRKQTGSPLAHCVASAVVDTLNSGRGGKKLPSWWKDA